MLFTAETRLFVASSRLLALLSAIGQLTLFEQSSSISITINEELSLGTDVLQLPAFCGNINSWTEPDFYTVQVSPTTYFNWNGAVEAIVVTSRLDRDTAFPGPTTSFTVTVTSSICPGTATLMVNVMLRDINDNPPVPVDLIPSQITHVTSTTPLGAQICVVSATDLDEGINAIHTYSLVQGDGTFIIDSVTGVITLAGQVSHANSPYTIDIQITDTGNPVLQSAGMVVTVHYVISYAPPKFTRNTYTVNINETLAMGPLWLVNVTATKSDPDPMAVIAYSIFSDPTGGLFSIDPVTGSVYIQGPLDVAISPQYVVIVQATLNIASPFNEYFCSGSVYRSYAAVRVFIRDTINQPPVCLHDVYFFELPENTAVGSLVGTNIGAVDYDQIANRMITYTLISDTSGGTFQVQTRQNIVSLYLLKRVVYESLVNQTFILMLAATDRGGQSCTMTVYIGVEDVNNNPPVVQPAAYCIHEKWTAGVLYCLPTPINVTDLDTPAVNGPIVLSVFHDSRFSINATQHLCVHDLDYEVELVVNVTILAKDNGGVPPFNQGYAVFTINVINDNDNAPYFVPYNVSLSLLEQLGYSNFLTLQVYDADLPPYNNLCVNISDTTNNFTMQQGVLLDNGMAITTAQLSVTAVLQYSAQQEWKIVLWASDLGCASVYATSPSADPACTNTAMALTGTAMVNVSVISRNNLPPMFTNIVYTGCMLENTTSLTLVAPISATDPQGREVTYAIQSQQVTAFSINNATGKLSVLNASLVNYESYPPNPHIISVIVAAWNAPDYLHVSVTSTTTILIKILPVNEFAPELTAVRVHSQSPMDQFSSELFSPPELIYYIPEDKLCNTSLPLMTLTARDADAFDETTGCNQSLPFYILESVTPANRLTITESGHVMLTSCLDYSPVYSNGACPNTGDRNIAVQVKVCDCQGSQLLQDCTGNTIPRQPQCSIRDFTIVVTDVNDNPPIITTGHSACIDILEDTPGGTPVTTVTAVDCDFGSNAIIYYDILDAGNAGDKFTLNMFNGSITVSTGAILDYEIPPINLTFVVGAYNPTTPLLTSPNNATVEVCLTNAHNDPPYFIGCPYDWTIAENDNTPLSGQILATSEDTSVLGQLTYSLSVPPPIPSAWFTIPNPSSPVIAVNGVDREYPNLTNIDSFGRAVVNFNISVTDGKFITTCQITVYILDVNDNPPVFNSSMYTAYVDECSLIGTPVLTVYATDADATPQNRIILYTITSGNTNNEFALDVSTGTMTTQQLLNYIITMSYTMSLKASNPDGLFSANSVTTANILVNECNNHPPVFVNCPHEWVIDENNNSALTGILVTDADINPAFRNLTYSLAVQSPLVAATWFTIPNPSSSDIAVNGVDRELFTSADQVLRGVVMMRMEVTDGKFTSTCQITVYVLDVNDNPPVFNPSNYPLYLNECSPIGTPLFTVYATDADATPQNRIILYTITSGNTNNVFRLDMYTGNMTTQQLLNYLITTNYTMSLKASNPDGLYYANYSVAVADVVVIECNVHGPVFIGCPYSWVIDENTVTTLTGVIASDANVNPQLRNLIYSLNVQNPFAPIPLTWFTIPDPYSPNISVNSVDRENITQADGLGRGIVTMTIYVADGKYTSACEITVLVVDLNDNPPIFNPVNYAATVLECSLNGTTVNTIYATDADATAKNRIIIYTIVSGNPNNTFALDRSAGVVTALGPFDICITPTYTLSISAANPDGLNNTILATDAITVGCCNGHSPIFLSSLYNATVLEYNSLVPPTCSQPMGSLISVNATDGDCCPVYGEVVGYSIIGGDPLGIFTINATGSVGVAQPQLIDYEDSASYLLTIAAMDGGDPPLSGIARVSVRVAPQHDHCPVFGVSLYTTSVHEDALNGTVLQIYPPITADEGDETNPMISFSISGGPFNITSDGSIVQTTMPITYIQSRPYYLLTINVTELQIGRENTSTCAPYCNATALLNVTVLPINTPCIFTSDWVNYCPTVASYIPVGSVIKTVQCVDTDLGLNGQVSYYMYGGNGRFAIDAHTGNITVASSLVGSVSEQYTISIVAQDQGSPPLSTTITLSFSIALDRNPPYFTRTVFKGSASKTTPIGTSLLTVVATDDDVPLVPAGTIQYTIEPWTRPIPFSLDATTGQVYVNSSLSAASVQAFYAFLVKAVDGHCWQAVPDAIVEISIVDMVKPRCVFTAPYYRSSTWLLYTANFSVGLWENASIGSLVIDLQLNSSTQLSNFSLIAWSPGANTMFNVHPNGSITVRNTLPSTKPNFYIAAYNLTVASQCDSSVATITVSIYVLDVNDHSPVINNISYCIPEYTPIGTNITELTLHATDVDLYENAYLVYTCVQPAPVFVDTLTGVVTLNTTLNRLVINQYPFVLCYATDRNGRGRTTAVYLNITVCPYVNHPPFLQPELQNMTVCEMQPPGFIGQLLAFDADTVTPFSTIYYSIIGGVAYLNGKLSTAFINETFPFLVAQSDGRVFTTALLDRDIVDEYYITVQVSNNDTAAMKNISTIGTLVITVCDVNNHPPVINSSLVCIAQHPIVGTPVTVLTATDRDVADTPFSTVWFWITDQTLGFTTDNVTGLVTTSGYNGAAGQNVFLPILAYDNYGTYPSLSSTATVEVVVYDACSQVVMTLCESSKTVENVCQDLIARMLSEVTGFSVCATHTENVGDTIQALTDLYLYFYDNKTYQGLPSQSALTLIDLNSEVLTYFQSSGCCIKDVKPYTCPTLLLTTPVPIWVPSSIAGLLALILSMICCVACIATSYWCRKYKKLKVSKTSLKRSMTSQLEQFSYQSEVNTTTNPLWVSPYEVDASTVYESQELTIDMFQDDDDSANTSETTRPNQLYESQELVVDVLTDEGDFDFAPLVTKIPTKTTLYESQELQVDVVMNDDDLEPAPAKQSASASQVQKNTALDLKPGPSKQVPAKSPAKSDLKAPAKSDPKAPAKSDPKAPAKSDPKAPAKSDPKAPAKSDPKAPAKSDPQYESQELKVEMFHDNSEFDLEPLSSSQLSAKSDPLYESQELKIEMFHDNMDDDSELIAAQEQATKSKKATSQKQQPAIGNSQNRSGQVMDSSVRTSSSQSLKGNTTRHSTPLRTGPNISDDDDLLLEHTLDGSDIAITHSLSSLHLPSAIGKLNSSIAPSNVVSVESLAQKPPVQKTLSAKIDDFQFNQLFNSSSLADKACLLSISSPPCIVVVVSCPSEGLGLHLNPDQFQMAIKWWLGLDTSGRSLCSLCPDTMLDSLGHHASTYHSHTRPADVLVQNWSRGRPAAFDICVTSQLNTLTLSEVGVCAGAAAQAGEARKQPRLERPGSSPGWRGQEAAQAGEASWLMQPRLESQEALG
eukprot:Em0018g1163a